MQGGVFGIYGDRLLGFHDRIVEKFKFEKQTRPNDVDSRHDRLALTRDLTECVLKLFVILVGEYFEERSLTSERGELERIRRLQCPRIGGTCLEGRCIDRVRQCCRFTDGAVPVDTFLVIDRQFEFGRRV